MLLERGATCCTPPANWKKQAVRLHQGWENTLILNVDATFPFPLLAPSIAAFYRQHHATRLGIPPRYPRRKLADADGRAGGSSAGRTGRPAGAQRLRLDSAGRGGAGVCCCAQHPLAQIAGPLGWRTLRRHRAITTDGAWPQAEGQESLTVFDLPAQLMLLCAGLGWSYLPLFQVQALIARGELLIIKTTVPEPVNRAWIGWNEDVCGQAGEWWRKEILANSAIHQVYNTKIV